MRKRLLKLLFLGLAAGLLVSPGPLGQLVVAQDNSSLTWDRPVTVTRKPPRRGRVRQPPKRRRARPEPVEKAPLMTLQWRVMKVGADGNDQDTNPGAVFYPGDRLRLAVKVNQSGYLTIVHQSGPDQDGMIVFPDSRINGGQNFVEKNQECVIPSACPAGMNSRDCSLMVAPPAGVEIFTLIFSRDLISDLTIKAAQAGGLKPQMLQEFKAESGQVLKRKRGVGTGPYAIWVINTNAQDNEEIIETLVLNKGNVQASR
ncbi:MAG: DUF4384 domain-containing protein [Pyrinomonadaceae bacterium]